MAVIFSSAVGVEISFIDWFWILAILNIVLLLPITIGGMGLREGALIGVLGMLSVPPEKAIVISFGFFGIQISRLLSGAFWRC
jgi:uncharacterized membrane protein YbhN (UPF0104 family)